MVRCLLYLLTSMIIFFFFIRRRENRTQVFFGLSLFVLCTIVLLNRELVIRPHLFSYLFIAVFLYIIEFKRDMFWVLPALGILWSNIHGIEFPVMFLIIFAYLAENYWWEFKRDHQQGEGLGKRGKWYLISVLYTIFITPGFVELIQIPFSVSFESAAYQHLYVNELKPIPLQHYFIFAPVTIRGIISMMQNAIVFLSVGFLLISLWKRKLRISHAILFAGAILLLARHNRFTCEFTLLSIPLLRHGANLIATRVQIPRKMVNLALPGIVVLLPLMIFHGILGTRPAYPFSPSNLPTGVVRFLNTHASGGRILNEMNTGGYLPWALKPEFKIFMDMQMTIFSDTDFAELQHTFYDINTFRAFIRKYDPSFISVSIYKVESQEIIAQDKRFVPVFFDHAEVLFVNKNHHKDLAERYALKAIDPFHYWEIDYASVGAERLEKMYSEALRIFEQDPENYRANNILSSILVVRRQFDQAMRHAEAIVRNYPELSHGYALKGDAFFGMERYEDAARLYKKALDMGRTAKVEHVYWNLHASYFNLKEYEKAYRVLSKYVNPFSPHADYREIYQLGVSAAFVGKAREAVKYLTIAKMMVPPSDTEYVQKIDVNLYQLSDKKPPSP